MTRPETILVTGDKGYVGSVLTTLLLEREYPVTGLDTGYYADCLLGEPGPQYPLLKRDTRDVTAADLRGVYAVIHLAALSNDPLGELSPDLTEEINLSATIRLAKLARDAGVSRFVYASAQSMYGVSNTDGELDEDDSEKNPITSYARTKWDAELALKALGTDEFVVVCFRPSTVFGASPRLRCDIVFNSLVACAYTTGRIEIKSDGTPWRPVVHVRDVCAAFIAGVEAPASIVAGRSYNVGIANGNFSVRDLAEAAGRTQHLWLGDGGEAGRSLPDLLHQCKAGAGGGAGSADRRPAGEPVGGCGLRPYRDRGGQSGGVAAGGLHPLAGRPDHSK